LILACSLAEARDSVLTSIPSNALGFAVVHNLADLNSNLDDLAKLVQAPAPDLLTLAKNFSGMQKGIDDQGDLAIVLMGVDPAPKIVALVPVANFADLCTSLNVNDPAHGIVEVQINGAAKLLAHKDSFAVLIDPSDRDVLEAFLAVHTHLASDSSLSSWLEANKASIVITSRGLAQAVPKLIAGIRTVQAQVRQVPSPQSQTTAESLNLYADLVTAAAPEVEQFGLGLRIDAVQTIDLVKRIQFVPGGAWAKWAAGLPSATNDFLADLPAGPFIAVMGGIVPHGGLDQLMKFSVQMMKQNPAFNLTPEQAEKYVQLSSGSMRHVRSMRIRFGPAELGAGIYGNTTALMTVDDSKAYLDDYEKTLVAMSKFGQEVKSPFIPVPDVQHTKLSDTEVLEITMDVASAMQATPPGGPDTQAIMRALAGPEGKLKVFVGSADEHTVVMAYTSLDSLESAIKFYKSHEPGLAADPNVAKVAAMLPSGSQLVAYVNLSGVMQAMHQFFAVLPNVPAVKLPEFAPSPPLGMAAKVSATGMEGHLVIAADTLRTVGEMIAKFRQSMPHPLATPENSQ
jgi:hypothetical protein